MATAPQSTAVIPQAASSPAPQQTPLAAPPQAQPSQAQSPSAFDSLFDQAASGDQNGVNESSLAKYPPEVRGVARGLANYTIPLPSGIAISKPYWTAAMQAAQEYDPSFDASQYKIRQNLKNSFTSGEASNNIRSLNTVMAHLAALKQSANALNNTGFTPFNYLANEAEQTFGDPRVNNFQTNADAVANELTRVFRGTNGAEADVQGWRQRLSANASPGQQQGAIDKAIELAAGRMGALRSQYESGMGKPPRQQFMSSQARAILHGMGYDPDQFEQGMAQRQVSQQGSPQQGPAAQAQQPQQPHNPNPGGYTPGQVYGGLLYLGGDIHNRASWRHP